MSKKTSRPALSAERIVALALQIIDDKGLAALSMRGLATQLGVEPMSLYHWFRSRDHLMDAMLDEFLKDVRVETPGPWSEQLTQASHAFRAACRAHPGLVPYVVIHRFNTRLALEVLEGLLDIVARLHAEPKERAAAFRLYMHWLIGFCLDEAAGFSKGPSAQNPPTEEEVVALFPHVVELAPFNRSEHFDVLFQQGLSAVLRAMRRV